MGHSSSRIPITEEEMQDYLDLTFLTRSEIIHAFNRFRDIDPTAVDRDKLGGVPIEKVIEIAELKANPFREQIAKVFSSQAGNDAMNFEDFLDMASVFSEASPAATKIEYAFRIYDFDGDGMLSRADIAQVVRHITRQKDSRDSLTDDDLQIIVDKVLAEADLDGDNCLSYAEFEHAMNKSIDFATTYLIRL